MSNKETEIWLKMCLIGWGFIAGAIIKQGFELGYFNW